MEIKGIVTFIVVGGIVWGGFIYFLLKAIKFERVKKANG